MERGYFDRPVRVALNRGGAPRQVTDVVDATEILLKRWPLGARSRRKHAAALDRCHTALEHIRSKRALRKAREAFEEAADEARILVPAQTREPHSAATRPGILGKLKRYM